MSFEVVWSLDSITSDTGQTSLYPHVGSMSIVAKWLASSPTSIERPSYHKIIDDLLQRRRRKRSSGTLGRSGRSHAFECVAYQGRDHHLFESL